MAYKKKMKKGTKIAIIIIASAAIIGTAFYFFGDKIKALWEKISTKKKTVN